MKVVFFSVILPSESPRIIQRLNPIFKKLNYQTLIFSFRNKIFKKNEWQNFLKKCWKDKNIIICIDPLALLICRALRLFKKTENIFVYDRNEKWPYNWKYRSNLVQKIIYLLPKTFIFFEKMLLNNFKFIISTDTITVREFKLNKFIIPNRVYYPVDLISKKKKDFILYFGTFSTERGGNEILKIFSENLLEKYNVSLKIYTKKKFHHDIDAKSKIKFCEFSNSKSKLIEASEGILGLVYQKHVDKNIMSIIPSKISTYWQLNLPVVIIGENKLFKRLESFYPNAIKNISLNGFTFNFEEVIEWAKSSKINYKPRKIELKKLDKLFK